MATTYFEKDKKNKNSVIFFEDGAIFVLDKKSKFFNQDLSWLKGLEVSPLVKRRKINNKFGTFNPDKAILVPTTSGKTKGAFVKLPEFSYREFYKTNSLFLLVETALNIEKESSQYYIDKCGTLKATEKIKEVYGSKIEKLLLPKEVIFEFYGESPIKVSPKNLLKVLETRGVFPKKEGEINFQEPFEVKTKDGSFVGVYNHKSWSKFLYLHKVGVDIEDKIKQEKGKAFSELSKELDMKEEALAKAIMEYKYSNGGPSGGDAYSKAYIRKNNSKPEPKKEIPTVSKEEYYSFFDKRVLDLVGYLSHLDREALYKNDDISKLSIYHRLKEKIEKSVYIKIDISDIRDWKVVL